MGVQVLYYGVAGTLKFAIPEGRPTAAVLTIKKKDGTDLTTAVSAVDIIANFAVPNVETTISADAAQGSTTVTLTAVTGLVSEHEYQLGSGLVAEWVRVRSFNATTKVVTLYTPTERAHVASEVFVSTELYYQVTVGNNDSQMASNMARLAYTVAGSTFKRNWLYDVKFHKFQSTLTSSKLLEAIPKAKIYGWREQKGVDGVMVQGLDLLRDVMLARGRDLDNLIDTQAAELAHIEACKFKLAEEWAFSDETLERSRDYYETKFVESVNRLEANARWWEVGAQDQELEISTEEDTRYAVRMRRA